MQSNALLQTQAEFAPDQTVASANPFVGLRPFTSDESILFFGRREQTVELLEQLHRTHFVAVVGSSGCGKSSLIRAGLIPKLKAGFLVEERDRWLVATMKPGEAPMRNLAAALLEAVSETVSAQEIDSHVHRIRQFGAEAILLRLAPALYDSSNNLLLVVDQFEEIFRFGVESGEAEKRGEAADFVSIMLELGRQRRLPIYVVMTMRSDFLGDCDNFYGLPEAMNRSQYLVPRLTRQQRRQAIEGPIRLFGARITPRLLDRVLNDVGEQSDQLPVMQHALMRTWEYWKDSGDEELDLKHYDNETVGTVEKALSNDANNALKGMSEEELRITRQIFQTLTDTDARNRRIQRPAYFSEIRAVTGAAPEQVSEVIERFRSGGRSLLVISEDKTKDDPIIDISHECLIKRWEKLEEWVDEEVESQAMYLRIVDAARRYEKGQAELWRGVDLQMALAWRKQNQPNATWARRYDPELDFALRFLEQSQEKEPLFDAFADSLIARPSMARKIVAEFIDRLAPFALILTGALPFALVGLRYYFGLSIVGILAWHLLRDHFHSESSTIPQQISKTFSSSLKARLSLVRRVLAEIMDRLFPFAIAPIIALPMMLIGWNGFFWTWVGVAFMWHLLRDSSPIRRSIGKHWFGLRVVAVNRRGRCALWRVILRRILPALSQVAYSIAIVAFLMRYQQPDAIEWPWPVLVQWAKFLFLFAFGYDVLSLSSILISPEGRRIEDYVAGTKVVTESSRSASANVAIDAEVGEREQVKIASVRF